MNKKPATIPWPNLGQTLTNTWRRRWELWIENWEELGSSVFCTISFQFNESGPAEPFPASHSHA